VLCDVDGTLAPIVRDPGSAAVPEETRAALRALARRYALVACISGRRAVEARRLVGVEELAYAGNHGLELLAPRAEEVTMNLTIADGVAAAEDFVREFDPSSLRSAGLRLEDKGPIQALHWREAADEDAAQRRATDVAAAAREAGLEPHWGRKVLEIRPASGIDKGTAVKRLLAEQPIERALFAGDDRTDLDAFRALRSLVAAGGLATAVCIGIGSAEAPPELSQEADAVVGGTEELLAVLRALAEPGDRARG
jgi:trehalose 6-phosphate phosphatase